MDTHIPPPFFIYVFFLIYAYFILGYVKLGLDLPCWIRKKIQLGPAGLELNAGLKLEEKNKK